MPYDPHHHHRRSIRLRGYDYGRAGIYFVTICTYQRQHLFNNLQLRQIAEEQWAALARAGSRGACGGRVALDAFVVMPDHMHGIIIINDRVANDGGADATGAGWVDMPPDDMWADVDSADNAGGDAGDAAAGGDAGDAVAGGDAGDAAAGGDAGDAAAGGDAGDAAAGGDAGDAAAGGDAVGAQQQPGNFPIYPMNWRAAAAPLQCPGGAGGDAPVANGAARAAADTPGLGINVTPGSLGAIVRSYKASVARRVNAHTRRPGAAVWQRGYYERIIRDARGLAAVRRYIADNPRRWEARRDNLDALLARMCPHTERDDRC
ncbi:hypothetical protein K2Z83_06725 [Oscillochloris sp. ZM17-4]|uniref:transposase n=1 Tax=Oscillochloris sp. ZM17-4 TaxID=2866714 RepID=UPI001C72DFEB|nr:transposase [Oscillochloris sp. ZM17-4]MBX0327369.1 hypothetical protein [Oscillochloris sp. ZM17-4]